MNRVIIIQARMTSKRLPGKVLKDVSGRPMLAQQVRRLRKCEAADAIVIATTENRADDPVADLARDLGIACFRGSEQDVLGRYVGAAREARADVVVRVTADCPLIDPGVVDRVIRELTDHSHECDYASNVLSRTYPRGLDTEAFFFDALLRAGRLARSPQAREHVTLVIVRDFREAFLCRSVEQEGDNSSHRWTVDTEADLEFVRTVYEEMQLGSEVLPYCDILAFLRGRPDIVQINAGIETWDPLRNNR